MDNSFQRKIVDLEGLKAGVQQARANGQVIVHCHGCFDIIHPGHIRHLEFARRQGDVLVVTLTGDAQISKGDQRPYIPQELRAESIAALESVDLVYIDPHLTAKETLEVVKPDVYIKGAEYDGSNEIGFQEEKEVVERHGGRVIFSSGEVVFSSTRLLKTMVENSELESHRLGLICRRHDISNASLEAIMNRFANQHVLVVGDLVVDRYVFCDAVDIANESPMMALSQVGERNYLGGAAIIARHLAALGARPFLLSAVGEDDRGQAAREVLAGDGVESHLLPARRSTVEKTRYLVEDTKLFKVEKAEKAPLDSLAEKKAELVLMQHARHGAKLFDAAIFCDFGYGMITGGLLSRTIPTLRKHVAVLTATVSGTRGNLLNFNGFDVLCPTERELRATLHDFERGLSNVAHQIMMQTGSKHLFVTHGKRGMVVFDRQNPDPNSPEYMGRLRSEWLPSLTDYAADQLGCGDALLSAATLAMSAGANLNQAAYLGSAAAAIEARRIGNVPVDRAMLSRWLRTRVELMPSEKSVPATVTQ